MTLINARSTTVILAIALCLVGPAPALTGLREDGSSAAPDGRYKLKANDVLTLSFRFTPDFDQEVSVQPDGFVQLKGLSGAIHVQGLTVPEAREAFRKAYSGTLHDPVITAVLKDFEKPYFIVSGSVRNPGKFDLRGHTTIMEAVALAGGFDKSAKHSQILIMRRVSSDLVEVTMVDLRQVTKGQDLSSDVLLKPGDTIFIPKSAFAKFDRFLPSSSIGAYQRY